jgi:hypothetical protein
MRPKLIISSEFWKSWQYLVQKSSTEVSILADCILEGQEFKITEMYLIPQVNSGGATDMDDVGIARLLTSFVREGKDPSIIRCWIHSHCNFGVFWSDVDTSNIRRLGQSAPWFVSIVTNKKGEVKTRLDVFNPVHLTMHDIPYTVPETNPVDWERLDKFLQEDCRQLESRIQFSSFEGYQPQPELFEWANRTPREESTQQIDLEAEINAHEQYLAASDPNSHVYHSALAALVKMKEEWARRRGEGL